MTAFFDLPTISAFIIAFAVFAYVVMDGFDLGIGILFPLLRPGPERDTAMNSVAPVWDGNETWLVLGGGGLMAAFPLAYAIIMPALYAPIIAMLLALDLSRGGFRIPLAGPGPPPVLGFRLHHRLDRRCLGARDHARRSAAGYQRQGRAYGGGWWDWLTPFSLLVGVSLVIGYALLGATWLIMKTDGSTQEKCFRFAGMLGPATMGCIVLVSAVTPFLSETYYQHWFSWPRILYAAQVPLLVAITSVGFYLSLRHRREYLPFLLSLTLFGLCLAGLGVSMFPYVVPGAVTIWDAAAPASSLSSCWRARLC